jgi:hypothetical protein
MNESQLCFVIFMLPWIVAILSVVSAVAFATSIAMAWVILTGGVALVLATIWCVVYWAVAIQ